jgi:spore germination protein GerM
MSPRVPRRWTGILVIALVAMVVACGIGAEQRATTVEAEHVPFELLDPDATTPQASQPVNMATIEVFLIAPDGRRLVPVRRDAGDRTLDSVISTLAEGPTPAEAEAELRTALPAADMIVQSSVSGGVAAIDLRSSFRDLSSRNQLLAIAQLVYTATAQPGIGRVGFTIEGVTIEVPRGDGSLVGGSVSRESYASLAPLPS